MPGWTNADNKFGVSPFIVGQTLGDGCNYSSVQSAINDCAAAGGGVVFIRASTVPYVENLTLLGGVNLQGCDSDGRLPAGLSKITIQGNHTFAPVGAVFEAVIINCIDFNDPALGDIFTVTPTGGAQAILAVKYCNVETSAGGAGLGHCFVLNADITSAAIVACEFGQGVADANCFLWSGAGTGQVQCHGGTWIAIGGPVAEITSGSSASISAQETQLRGGNYTIETTIASTGISLTNSYLSAGFSSPSACLALSVSGASCSSLHCTFECNDPGGNFVVGAAGTTFAHADSVIISATPGILGATEQIYDWKPWAQSGATSLGTSRGTAAFDSSQFTLTDGWVQLAAGATGITTLQADDATTTTGSTVALVGVDGITTLNAGAGTITIDDKRWLSAYVVDLNALPGNNNAEYTSIAAAVAAAGAAGGGNVYIRPGGYTENFTMQPNVYLEGAIGNEGDGPVSIFGNINIDIAGACGFTNLSIQGNAGNAITGTVAGNSIVYMDGCQITQGGGGFSAINVTGNSINIQAVNCKFSGNGTDPVVFLELGGSSFFKDCQFNGGGGSRVVSAGSIPNQLPFLYCRFINGCPFYGTGASSSSLVEFCDIESDVNESIIIDAGAIVAAYHTTCECDSGTGFFVSGTGSFAYGNIVNIGTQNGIDPGLTITKVDLKPFATTGTYPTSSPNVQRGYSAFDDAYFTATDGQVTLQGSVGHAPIYRLDGNIGSAEPPPINVLVQGKAGCYTEAGVSASNAVDIYALKWIDVAAVGGAVANFGHYVTATHTRTLPAAPDQGTVCSFIVTGAATVLTIQAPGTALIRIGSSISSAGGTATSTAQGDALRLVYKTTGDTWYSEQAPQGNWTLA